MVKIASMLRLTEWIIIENFDLCLEYLRRLAKIKASGPRAAKLHLKFCLNLSYCCRNCILNFTLLRGWSFTLKHILSVAPWLSKI